MPYVPDWERLADALKRVMATGIREQAKQDICNAIADRKIRIRGLVAKEDGLGSFGERVVGTVRRGGEIEIPSHLGAHDFDWDKSRPVSPWHESQTHGPGVFAARWQLDWIELCRADVTAVLCGAATRDGNETAFEPPSSATRLWREPQADWLPLGKAVFRFGVACDGNFNATNEEPLLIESEMAEGGVRPFTLGELAEVLKQNAGADDAEIDTIKGTFSFVFHSPRGASMMGGPPWATLDYPPNAVPIADPRLYAEALFNKVGFVRVDDEDAARYAKQVDGARKATTLVWRQFMIRAFDHAVSAMRVKLYGRIRIASAPFQRLPSDIWPILNIVDWQNGIACDPEGIPYFSIHAESTYRKPPVHSIAAVETAATRALALQLRSNSELTRTEAATWCDTAGFKLTDRGFQSRVWPRARAQAGLADRAPPGRKRKSSR
jgi:hypothetical protein